jgi:hypothetical protein
MISRRSSHLFVIDDDDDKLASALAKLAEPMELLRPPMHPPRAAISWLSSFLDGAGKTCRQEIFSI